VSILQRPDASVAFEVSGDGPPATLLHGFTQRGDVWAELRRHLGPDRRWISIDIRGHGATRTQPGAPHSLEACADDVVAVWDALRLERSHVVGYSMGGRLALHAATRYPHRLRSLCLIGAHAGLEPSQRAKRRREDEALAERIERDGLEWFARYWSEIPLLTTLRGRRPEVSEHLQGLRGSADPAGFAASLRAMGAGRMEPLWSVLHRITCPVLVMAGADDARYVPYAQRLCDALPDARLAIVSEAGHAAHLEQPAAVAALIRGFLAEVESAAGDAH
jgi:2-succinyl-6-hydroxy-2,4-cyclohexadiene-1-carboxylate synthase